MDNELTEMEKSILLGIVDGDIGDNYDRDFYEAMYRTAPLLPTDLDDGIRRAILRYIKDGTGIATAPGNGGLVMMGFAHGYMVGRKLRKDIRKADTGQHQS